METAGQPLNPWLSIWVRPRATIRYIVDTDTTYRVYLLAALAGVVRMLGEAVDRSLGDHLPWWGVVALVLVFGPLGGWIGLYVSGAIFYWIGRKLGGVATSEAVRAAVAWSSLPGIAVLIPLAVYISIMRSEAFTSATPRLDALVEQSTAWAVTVIVLGVWLVMSGVVLSVWQFVLLSKTLGEVHGFSAWRGLLTWLLPGLVLFIIVFVIFVLPKALYIGP